MLTVAFAQRWRDSGITVNSCHPGDASSALSNALGFGGSETPEQAAATPVWLATESSLADTTGQYFANCRPARCAFAADVQGIAELDAICARF
jgi:NAD(P)-dependent dehydrogenase (short-subunit alcohol dehydrogenase family)